MCLSDISLLDLFIRSGPRGGITQGMTLLFAKLRSDTKELVLVWHNLGLPLICWPIRSTFLKPLTMKGGR